ncbi:hypothetical protein E2C01_089872 [Portunus trituberculatus]|uniref:Uncharacterized protein n=1 Tax=Portunus trituberculatus TaxID=210409 RepID=A0A5B7JER5_PORTR|nr:hypothetical protein [Portunus trituberculatus]
MKRDPWWLANSTPAQENRRGTGRPQNHIPRERPVPVKMSRTNVGSAYCKLRCSGKRIALNLLVRGWVREKEVGSGGEGRSRGRKGGTGREKGDGEGD